ncbi:mariner Mos1 transposase [Trichonephila clavata]|uniref:Mariner Mos1 transposase n=1 Tax=Trichonephila clavata TaxID=2740835 RepID=A0A8X6LGU9_TRICU|nr:mariner Mos1 transposase [Trichonephila clavata]
MMGYFCRLQLVGLSRSLKEIRPLYEQRNDKGILLRDNARPHAAKTVTTYLETLKWEVISQPPYTPDIASTNYHLLRSMVHGMDEKCFPSVTDLYASS